MGARGKKEGEGLSVGDPDVAPEDIITGTDLPESVELVTSYDVVARVSLNLGMVVSDADPTSRGDSSN